MANMNEDPELYQCEHSVWGIAEQAAGRRVRYQDVDYVTKPFRRFQTVTEVEQFVTLVFAHPGVYARFGGVVAPKVVVDGRFDKRSVYRPGEQTVYIARKSWAMTDQTVLHEVAHHIVEVTGGCGPDSHGRRFLDVYGLLVGLFVAEGNADLLRAMLGR